MNGLQIAKAFYEQCKPQLVAAMPEVMAQACAGLAGEGSECFGCDDDTSRDHDFTCEFCLWLPAKVLEENGALIRETFKSLPKSFNGLPADFLPHPASRRGPRAIEDYYLFFTGLDKPPQDWRQWLAIPEYQLAAAVNGEVFEDNNGAFTAWREKLLAYYPEDVRLKKMAAKCMQMAQSGQYNLPRALMRGEGPAAMLAAARFAESAISLVFLLNRKYMPFYKWAPRLGRALPILGRDLGVVLDGLAHQPLRGKQDIAIASLIEDFCAACAARLHAEGLSDEKDAWLWAHGPELISRVKEPAIQAMDLLQG